jgi:hypothetical protein
VKEVCTDLSPLLESWRFEPSDLQVRRIFGEDGRPKLQMRIELGILQMEASGRPDGQRPHGHQSLLEYHEERLAEARRLGHEKLFRLSTNDCAEIRQESMQYYCRYLCLFSLRDYTAVLRDTRRNLRLFDLVLKYASNEEDRYLLERHRPAVLMMRTRAQACLSLESGFGQQAIEQISEGVEEIRAFHRRLGQPGAAEDSEEIETLRQMTEEILDALSGNEVDTLREEMQMAVESEDYEKAALLRDEIRKRDSFLPE